MKFQQLNRLVATWNPILGLDEWDFFDLDAAKEETQLAEKIQALYDELPAGIFVTCPIEGYYYTNSVELDELLN